METGGLFFAFFGAVVLFAADWQNMPVNWLAGLLFFFAAIVGFSVKRWRVATALFLTLGLVGAEWSSENLKFFKSDLSGTAPNLVVLGVVAFVLAYTATLVGGGVRSLVDAGTR